MYIFTTDFILSSFLILVRVTSIIMTAPFLGSQTFPTRVKLFFGLAVTVCLFPVISLQGAMIPANAGNLEVIIAILKEVLVGMSLGLVGQMIFGGVQFGGQFISIQTGLGFANLVDPTTQTQNPIVSQIFTLLGVVLFLAIDGEATYLRALAASFDILPVGKVNVAGTAPEFIKMASHIFVIGLQLAAPFIIVLFLLDLSFAIFARIMPQANIFFIAMPLKVLGGIIMLYIVSPKLGIAFNQFFQTLFKFLERIMYALGG